MLPEFKYLLNINFEIISKKINKLIRRYYFIASLGYVKWEFHSIS